MWRSLPQIAQLSRRDTVRTMTNSEVPIVPSPHARRAPPAGYMVRSIFTQVRHSDYIEIWCECNTRAQNGVMRQLDCNAVEVLIEAAVALEREHATTMDAKRSIAASTDDGIR